MAAGYWQVPVAKIDPEKMAFVTHYGAFQFTRMPFGLTNVPATFQRMMDQVLSGLKWHCTLVYLDDIIVYCKTFEEHLQHLAAVFQRLRDAQLKLKSSKCSVCCDRVPYLGYILTLQGIKPSPHKLDLLRDWPQSTSALTLASRPPFRQNIVRRLFKAEFERVFLMETREGIRRLPIDKKSFDFSCFRFYSLLLKDTLKMVKRKRILAGNSHNAYSAQFK
jgi:hypothetical protein